MLREHRSSYRFVPEITYSKDFPRLLLCLDGERRGEEAATHRANECPPADHWITSSARSSSDGGIVRPSAFAVLRLITSSNLVGCSMGRSAGLAPLKILSTYSATRRKRST